MLNVYLYVYPYKGSKTIISLFFQNKHIVIIYIYWATASLSAQQIHLLLRQEGIPKHPGIIL